MITKPNVARAARTTDAHMPAWFRKLMVFYSILLYVEMAAGTTFAIRLPKHPDPWFMQPPTILYDAEPNQYENDIWENCWEEFDI
jgi:hypothetical protein